MSDNYVPFDIQADIMKKLPVKSLVRFRCVSKQWKSLIDSSKFIKSYQAINHHLLLKFSVLDYPDNNEFFSIIDNGTCPQPKSHITIPLPVNIRVKNRVPRMTGPILGSSHGLICFSGFYLGELDEDGLSNLIVLWNPSIRKSFGIVVPNMPRLNDAEYILHPMSRIGFGVCPETDDPKIVKIDRIVGTPYDYWEVQVYTLSSKVWKKLSVKPPCESRDFMPFEGVSVKGFIYWLMDDESNSPVKSNLIVSFDLTNEEFGQVYLPDCLLRAPRLSLFKRNECLAVIDFKLKEMEVFGLVCDVWMMKDDGVTKSLTKTLIIRSSGQEYNVRVAEFRKNGDAIVETGCPSVLQVFDPCLGRISGDMGIDERYFSIYIRSYMETLLLLDE